MHWKVGPNHRRLDTEYGPRRGGQEATQVRGCIRQSVTSVVASAAEAVCPGTLEVFDSPRWRHGAAGSTLIDRRHDAACLLIRRVRVLSALAAAAHPPPFAPFSEEEVGADDETGEEEAGSASDVPCDFLENQNMFRARAQVQAYWEERGLLEVLGSTATAAAAWPPVPSLPHPREGAALGGGSMASLAAPLQGRQWGGEGGV